MRVLLMMSCAVLAMGGCGGDRESESGGGPQPASGSVATISVSPATVTMNIGDTRPMGVTLRDALGNALQNRPVEWTSDDTSRVEVSPTGIIRAIAAGSTLVRASAEGKSAVAAVVVPTPHAPVSRIVLDASTLNIEEGSSARLSATAFDAADNIISGRGVRWTTSDAETATVEVDGHVTALRAGAVNIAATIDGKSASTEIRIFADYSFDLVYGVADLGAPDELQRQDLTEPGTPPAPLFPAGRSAGQGTPSPDGSRIAFVVHGEWDGSTWPSMIYVADRNGGNAKRLTWNNARNTSPAWSPDGSRIAYASQVFGAPADIWTMNADGSDPVNATHDQAGASKRSPAWSPRSISGHHRIAYGLEKGGSSHIWTMREDGSDKAPGTNDSAYFDTDPAWSPDGSTLVFQRTGAATFGELYLVAAAGGAVRPLTLFDKPPHGQFAPAWSPDGKLIAFASKHEATGFQQIWTVWADGTRPVRRTSALRTHSDPAWIAKQ